MVLFFFFRSRKTPLDSYVEPYWTLNSQKNFEKKNKGESITLPDFEVFYKTTLLKKQCVM
jgi:hypothetical protein